MERSVVHYDFSTAVAQNSLTNRAERGRSAAQGTLFESFVESISRDIATISGLNRISTNFTNNVFCFENYSQKYG